jgi:hypothetical protein
MYVRKEVEVDHMTYPFSRRRGGKFTMGIILVSENYLKFM